MTFENVAAPVSSVRIHLDPVSVSHGANVDFYIEVVSERPVLNTVLIIVLYDRKQSPCVEWNSKRLGYAMSLRRGVNSFHVSLGPLLLRTGNYRLGVVLNDESSFTMLVWSFKKHEVNVEGFTALGAPLALNSALRQCPDA